MAIRHASLVATIAGLAVPVLLGTGSATAWETTRFENPAYFAHGLRLGDPATVWVMCAGYKPGVNPVPYDSHENETTEPGMLRVGLSSVIMGQSGNPRHDAAFVTGDIGYRLPAVLYDDFFGEWSVNLPANDPLWTGLSGADRAEIRVSDVGHTLPMAGFGAGFLQLQASCAASFAQIGQSWPSATTLPSGNKTGLEGAVEDAIARTCTDGATRDEGWLLRGDIDGDGAEDLVLDWRGIDCIGERYQGHCGASMCSADIFLSSGGPRSEPESILVLGVGLIDLSSGNKGLSTGGHIASCAEANDPENCRIYWYWNGSELVTLP